MPEPHCHLCQRPGPPEGLHTCTFTILAHPGCLRDSDMPCFERQRGSTSLAVKARQVARLLYNSPPVNARERRLLMALYADLRRLLDRD